jgi:hypothetical protein
MYALVLLLLLTASTFMQAQEVTYNTTPTHELGPELWQLPIGGQLTMSRDGKTLLVASMADTCFYVVDVTSGSILGRSSAAYYQVSQQGNSVYCTDNDITLLAIGRNNYIELYNLVTDSILTPRTRVPSPLTALSAVHDRLLAGSVLLKASTFDTVLVYNEQAFTTGWFDDDRGMLYRCVPNGVQEIDATTGVIIRGWGTNARAFSRAIRPQNSMWLYVFAWPESDKPESTFVDAIHLETGERVHYTHEYAGGGPVVSEFDESSYVYSTLKDGLMSSPSTLGSNYLSSFDAATRSAQAIVSPRFTWGSGSIAKENAVNPELTRYVHTWPLGAVDRDSCILRCNAMSPTTSILASDSTSNSALIVIVDADNLRIVEPWLETAITLDIIATDGRNLRHHTGEELVRQPVSISIALLPSGTYLCVVQLSDRRLTTAFTVVR